MNATRKKWGTTKQKRETLTIFEKALVRRGGSAGKKWRGKKHSARKTPQQNKKTGKKKVHKGGEDDRGIAA